MGRAHAAVKRADDGPASCGLLRAAAVAGSADRARRRASATYSRELTNNTLLKYVGRGLVLELSRGGLEHASDPSAYTTPSPNTKGGV